jgi:NAD(P)-dependent dehydrogenase (short-subunit alcohol dehydrogenase family)
VLVERIAAENDGLDFMFNNAGIASGGETHLLSVDAFRLAIDVNIQGVVNGVMAAYPMMVRQGRGCIVNTASASGLYALPLAVPYAMTKHAVVGLSNSLRIEAEEHGVQVCSLCPTAVETPLLETQDLNNSEAGKGINIRRYLTRLGGTPYPVDKFAEYALDCIEENRGVIVAPARARLVRFIGRLLPSIIERGTRQALRMERQDRDIDHACPRHQNTL